MSKQIDIATIDKIIDHKLQRRVLSASLNILPLLLRSSLVVLCNTWGDSDVLLSTQCYRRHICTVYSLAFSSDFIIFKY